MTSVAQQRGRRMEKQARRLLEKSGLETLAHGYRSRYGEIDLIMRDGDTLVFAEVRYRKTSRWGDALETIDRHKQEKIIATAQTYLLENKHQGPVRFDVIGYTGEHEQPRWIKNAFGAAW